MKTLFFQKDSEIFVVQSETDLTESALDRLTWLLGAMPLEKPRVSGEFIGPRAEMVTPWSSNVVDITRNIGIDGIRRVESFRKVTPNEHVAHDPMLEEVYSGLSEESLAITGTPEPMVCIRDVEKYNVEAGLALSDDEIGYLKGASVFFERGLTDSELFSFAQINSEHCRHKIFNGKFIIDGKEQEQSLFALIKKTTAVSPDGVVSAYKDNVAFIRGPQVMQFAPTDASKVEQYELAPMDTVISLKAETHNFPTTVEPFYGASTGTGGEIRDRLAGGQGSLPLVGTAVYMTSYPRLDTTRSWEGAIASRQWKYQSPEQILIKASNGASDFGNKFGQPIICGSLLTFEERVRFRGEERERLYAYDRTVMLAGGVGYANAKHAEKLEARPGDLLILLGGDNYRIGMAGGSVSSVDSGKAKEALELSAVQRANPEIQRRVANVIRAMVESSTIQPARLIHDHGAGGHINCFAELLYPLGGKVVMSNLPIGDPTLSFREIVANESQERMGLIIAPSDLPALKLIAARERAPLYVAGEVTGDKRLVFEAANGEKPVNVPMDFLFGSTPRTSLEDTTAEIETSPDDFQFGSSEDLLASLKQVLSLEAVACKDWLTNKVDRCVTGRIARQQCVGALQFPLSDMAITALDYTGQAGIALSIGHAPAAGMVNPSAGAILSIAEALTNIVFAKLEKGLESVVLSANWMWPAKQAHENARLYEAVAAASKFSQELGIPIPTGKDSLSMTMNYPEGESVRAPGTVVISAAAPISDVRVYVTPDLKNVPDSTLLWVNLSGLDTNPLGGSSFAQTRNATFSDTPTVKDPVRFKKAFQLIQELVGEGAVLAGHDVSSGGLLSTVCEMAFAGDIGVKVSITEHVSDGGRFLMTEKPGVVLQVNAKELSAIQKRFKEIRVDTDAIGTVGGEEIKVKAGHLRFAHPLHELVRIWYKRSYQLDRFQSKAGKADERYRNIFKTKLDLSFPPGFNGRAADAGVNLGRTGRSGLLAAVIREQGTNGERELAFAAHASGFDVRDVTMYDLMNGDETLDDVSFVMFPGGFANSDVLGAAKGWAGVFRYNERAMDALRRFFARPNTLSVGICNGCQLVVGLDLIYPEHREKMQMLRNESEKFESAFLNVEVRPTNSVLLKPLIGARLGIWVAHGEGRFDLPEGEAAYDIPLKYSASDYPANPNGADFNAAAVCSRDGRHLAIMPHMERSVLPRQWGYYPDGKLRQHEISPWMLAFAAARDWIREQR